MKLKRKEASIIVIGNEILSGKTLDTNSNYIAIKLREKGIICKEISVIPDNENSIIEKINQFRNNNDYVFTSGGIGPTHDDITSKSISKALSIPFEINKLAKKLIENHYSDEELTEARLKMAYMPKGSVLIDNPVSVAPGFNIQNIYVFPGVPKILHIMIDEFFKRIESNNVFYKKTISTTLSEGIVGEFISQIQKKYHELDIGSYPYFKKNSFGVSIVITGDKEAQVKDSSLEIYEYFKKNNGSPKLF